MCASAFPKYSFTTHKLPTVNVIINNCSVTALVDTGATVSIVTSSLCKTAGVAVKPANVAITVMQEKQLQLDGEASLSAVVAGIKCKIDCVVSPCIVGEFQMLIGNGDIEQQLGGVYVNGSTVVFGKAMPPAAMTTTHGSSDTIHRSSDVKDIPSARVCTGQSVQQRDEEQTIAPMTESRPIEREVTVDVPRPSLNNEIKSSDFTASFDGSHWTMGWIWKDKPPVMMNKRAMVGVREEHRDAFDATIQEWIDGGLVSERDVSMCQEEPGITPIICVYNE